ncbi:MAG: DUF4365 domain-containing protein [Streptosporangiales bacterium]|nr:DUF4365 domain-containing protein [Streptosporangiales bacterium]
MLDSRNHQGKFGQDYVRVLASAAGLLVYTPDLDRDGVDFLLRWPGPGLVGPAASPAIDVQVKSWSVPKKSGGFLRFDGLNEVQFNKLAGPNFQVPRVLFVVVVPTEKDAYSEIRTEGMLLRHQAYYLSLHGEEPISEPDKERRRAVQVPIGNVLTVRSLQSLMRAVPAATEGRAS